MNKKTSGYYDHFDVLKILKCSEQTLDDLIQSKQLKPAYSEYKYGGMLYHFFPHDVERVKAEMNGQTALTM